MEVVTHYRARQWDELRSFHCCLLVFSSPAVRNNLWDDKAGILNNQSHFLFLYFYGFFHCLRRRHATLISSVNSLAFFVQIICEESMSRLRGENQQWRAGDASCRQCFPSQMLLVRGVRHQITERRSICRQAESTVLSTRLREGGRDVSGISLWWAPECIHISNSHCASLSIPQIADDYCCEDVFHTRIDGRRGPKRPRFAMSSRTK